MGAEAAASRPHIRSVLAALERRLADDPALHRLPAKWSIVLDDGGPLSLAHVPADMRLVATASPAFRLQLDGLDHEVSVPAEAVPEILSRLGRLATAGPTPLRVRALAAERGVGLFDALGLPATRRAPDPRPAVTPADLLGPHETHLGVLPAFGAITAADLETIAVVLRRAGGRELRLTPWRVVLAPGLVDPAAALDALRPLDVVLRPDDPRLAVSACVGAPACHRATVPARADAARLAGRLGAIVHVAGCAKGCAQAGPAAWTLVGRDGRYDVVAGGARDAPAIRGLSFQDAATWLSRADHARTA